MTVGFDIDAVEAAVLSWTSFQQSAFAAFWAQRLVPMLRLFDQLEKRSSVLQLQACLDVSWQAAAAYQPSVSEIKSCQAQLEALAPELEVRPILAYAAMMSASATWEALETITSGGQHAIKAASNYLSVVLHYLMNRDYSTLLIATKIRDPLGLQRDPLFVAEGRVLNWVVGILSASNDLSSVRIAELRSNADDTHVRQVAQEMARLSLALKPA